jgi:hypothetical protein
MVAVDGVFQRAPIHYTASNSTITFSSAPPATSNVHVRHLGFRTTQTVTALPAGSTLTQPNIGGNLTLTGTGNRIRGDFSNTTVANRVMFQTSTANAFTGQTLIPNGTSPTAQFDALNSSSNPGNAGLASFGVTSTEVRLRAAITGTGTYLPMTFYTGGVERLRIPVDAAGIQFPASQAPSSDANTLDDYEEGTWTPSITGITVTSIFSTYTKIGNTVFLRSHMSCSANPGSTFSIAGLPFTSSSTNRTAGVLVVQDASAGYAARTGPTCTSAESATTVAINLHGVTSLDTDDRINLFVSYSV